MSHSKLYIFIINPSSGGGKGEKVWKKVKERLTELGVNYRSFLTSRPGHATHIVRQVLELHRDKIQTLVAIGGDGTVHEVFNGLRDEKHVPISYIPAGSGNDFARGFNISKNPLKALDDILKTKRRSRTIDSGSFYFGGSQHTYTFVNSLGCGFDGEVAKMTNTASYKRWLNKLRLGRLAYFITALRLLFHYKGQDLTLRIDGAEHQFQSVWLTAFCNIPYYGGGMKIVPSAKPQDGYISLCVVHNMNRWLLLGLITTVFSGKHIHFKKYVTILKGKQIELLSTTPMTIQADGEIMGTTPVKIEVNEKAYQVY